MGFRRLKIVLVASIVGYICLVSQNTRIGRPTSTRTIRERNINLPRQRNGPIKSSIDSRTFITPPQIQASNHVDLGYSPHQNGFARVISPRHPGAQTKDFLKDFLERHEDDLRDLLVHHGAVLLRGFKIYRAEDFNWVLPMQLGSDMKKGWVYDVIYKTIIASVFTFFKDLGNIDPKRNMNLGAGGRIQVLAPASDCIQGPHQESLTLATRLSQRYVAFHCETEPRHRGETAIFDTRAAYDSLDDDLKELLNTHSWRFRDTNGKFTNDLIPCVVEVTGKPAIQIYAFGEMGKSAAKVAREVLERDNLQPDPYLYGVTSFMLRNRETGEDREMDLDERERLMRALYQNSELCKWEEGDILLLDNVSCAHGRMDGKGERKINFCGICDYLFDINNFPLVERK